MRISYIFLAKRLEALALGVIHPCEYGQANLPHVRASYNALRIV
jgi:hypothetical protein